MRRETTVILLFTLLCSVVVDVERYWTVTDIACYKCKLLKRSDKIVLQLATLKILPHALQDAVGLG